MLGFFPLSLCVVIADIMTKTDDGTENRHSVIVQGDFGENRHEFHNDNNSVIPWLDGINDRGKKME